MTLVRLIHFLGMALWLGGGIAAMVLAILGRREDPIVRGAVHRLLASVHTLVIGLGALLTVASGLVMTMDLMTAGAQGLMAQPRLWIMQGAGLVGGLLVLLVGLPAAIKLGGVAVPDEQGRLTEAFERYRARNAMANAVGGTLALVALFAAVVL